MKKEIVKNERKTISKKSLDFYNKTINELGSGKKNGMIFLAIEKESGNGLDCLAFGNKVNKFRMLAAFKQGLHISPVEEMLNSLEGIASSKFLPTEKKGKKTKGKKK